MFLLSRKYMGAFFGAATTGALLGVAFPSVRPTPLFGLILPFAFVPLFWVLEKLPHQASQGGRTPSRIERAPWSRRAFYSIVLCWISGLVFELLAAHWLPVSIARLTNLGDVPSAIGYLGFSAIAALRIPLILAPFIVASARVIKRTSAPPPIWSLALTSMGIELLFPSIWPWTFGSLIAIPGGLSQWISVFGGSIYTPLLLGFAAWIARSVTQLSAGSAKFSAAFFATIFLWIGVWATGEWRQAILTSRHKQLETDRIGVVSADTDLVGKARPEISATERNSAEKLIELSKQLEVAANPKELKPSLIVWPPLFGHSDSLETAGFQDQIRTFSQQMGINFLVNSHESRPSRDSVDSKELTFNTGFLFRPDGSRSDSSEQLTPIPFMEYIPFEDTIPVFAETIRAHAPALQPRRPGAHLNALSYSPDVKVGLLLSNDVTSSDIARRLVGKLEAGVLVHQMDDVAFEGTGAIALLQEEARWRALEIGRTVVTVSNTGEHKAFGPTGNLISPEISKKKSWSLFIVPVVNQENFFETLYSELGNVPAYILSIIGLLFAVISPFRRKRNS